MKKILFGLLFAVLLNFQVNASEFQGGIIVGANASWLSNVSTVELWYKWYRFQGGLYVDYSITKQYFIKAEIKFIQRGNHIDPNEIEDYAVKLNYAEIPFLLGWYLPKNKFARIKSENLFIIGGLSYAHLINAKERIGFSSYSEFKEPEPSFKKYDLLSNLGLGYNFRNRFSAELRISSSFIPVRIHNDNNVYMVGNQKNRTISIITNFKF